MTEFYEKKSFVLTLRDGVAYVSAGAKKDDTKLYGRMYEASVFIQHRDNLCGYLPWIQTVSVCFPDADGKYKYLNGNFGVDLWYSSTSQFFKSWDIMDRRVLIEKTGFYI